MTRSVRQAPTTRLTRTIGLAASLALVAAFAGCTSAQVSDADGATTSVPSSSDATDATDASEEDATDATSTTDGSLTSQIQESAATLIALLDDDQRALLFYDYDDEEQKTVWSNLPVGSAGSTNESGSSSSGSGGGPGAGVARNGLFLADMTEEQQAAALAVVETFLSEQGYEQVLETLLADDYLNETNGGSSGWSSDLYAIAFFGDPTASDTFFIQFGGHHLAINVDVQGDAVSFSPEFAGIEPVTFTYDGVEYSPLAQETDSLWAVLDSLSDEEVAEAQLTAQWADLDKGAQGEGEYPADEDEGVLVSSLSADQQDLVTAAITAWVGDLDESVSDDLIAQYVADYDATYVSWSNSTDQDSGNAYVRISGTRLWIEYSQQPGIGTSEWHIHSVYRDKRDDYGTAAE